MEKPGDTHKLKGCETLPKKLALCEHCRKRLDELCGHLLQQKGVEGVCGVCWGGRGNYGLLLENLQRSLASVVGEWGSFRIDVVVEYPSGLEKDLRPLFDALKDDFKRELKREVGGVVEKWGKKFDPENPDIIIVYEKGGFSVRRPNLYLEGRYLKLLKNISQAKWICNSCGGGGCFECNYRGRHFLASVEEFIGFPLQTLFGAQAVVFHAGGREDVDVLVKGSGRPFVVEIRNPTKMLFDLRKIEETINSYSEGIVHVWLKGFCAPKRVEEIKRASETSMKKYEGLIRFYGKVEPELLEKAAKQLSGIVVEQRTPWRVKRRRADKLRYRRIAMFSMVPLDERTARFTVVCQGGTYVKEFISGDDGRTRPSVSQILGIRCKCVELSLMGVEIGNGQE